MMSVTINDDLPNVSLFPQFLPSSFYLSHSHFPRSPDPDLASTHVIFELESPSPDTFFEIPSRYRFSCPLSPVDRFRGGYLLPSPVHSGEIDDDGVLDSFFALVCFWIRKSDDHPPSFASYSLRMRWDESRRASAPFRVSRGGSGLSCSSFSPPSPFSTMFSTVCFCFLVWDCICTFGWIGWTGR